MKSIKTFFLLSLTFAVVTLNSCKKEKSSTTATATITANVDGTATTFNTGAIALTGSVNDATITNIEGTASNKTAISITISGKLTAGKTYTDASANDDDKPILLFSTADDKQFLNDDNSSSNPVSVTITAVSSTNVEGTFKGDLTSFSVNGNTEAKSITNGKFNVKLAKGQQ